MLNEEQKRLREGRVGASFVPYLMAGKEDRIREEWMRLVGHDMLVEPDFDAMWNLQFGSLVENLALDWHEKKTGKKLVSRQEFVPHPKHDFISATLDAYREEDGCVIDCKCWSSWQKVDYICSFLTPQIIVQRACKQASCGSILLVHGGSAPVELPLEWTDIYEEQVFERIHWFWSHVQSLTCPVNMPKSAMAPIKATKTYDMKTSNTWAVEAAAWVENKSAADRFNIAAKALRELVPEDAQKCEGHGVVATRNKAGAISVKEAA